MIKSVYPNLIGLMSVRGIEVSDISKCIGKRPEATRRRIAGDASFDINEAIKINDELFPDIPFKQLWSKEISKSA